jgi:predicted AAA+ superfamily ATPase
MFVRSLRLPDPSFFLFGPRRTGKSTLLHNSDEFDSRQSTEAVHEIHDEAAA